MGKTKEYPRYNILSLRVDDYILFELRGLLNGTSVSSYVFTALEEKIVRDRQSRLDDYLRDSR